MRNVFKSVVSFVGKCFSKVANVIKRAFSAVATVLRDWSIDLSGATSSFSYLAATVAAMLLGLPFTASLLGLFTILAMWGTVFYRDQVEQEKLRNGLYVVRAAGAILDIYETTSDIRASRRNLHSVG